MLSYLTTAHNCNILHFSVSRGMYRYRGYCLCAGVTRIVEVCLHISPNTAGIAKITLLSKTAANAEKREKYRGKLDKNENTRGKKE